LNTESNFFLPLLFFVPFPLLLLLLFLLSPPLASLIFPLLLLLLFLLLLLSSLFLSFSLHSFFSAFLSLLSPL
jgi:hypothetical protein